MDKKTDPFENKGNPVSEARIKEIVDHPGGEYAPNGDHTQKSAPPTDLESE